MKLLYFLPLFVGIYAQNSTGSNACTCSCCPPTPDGVACGVYGAFPVDDCANDCTSLNAALNCPTFNPDYCWANNSFTYGECGAADLNDDWAGDWVFDPCSACLLDEQGTPIGDCKPCCDPNNCIECLYGTVTFSGLDTVIINGKEARQLQAATSGTTSLQTTHVANETGVFGTTATLIVLDTYDLIKFGDHMQINSRSDVADCSFTATRNPAKPSMLKLALLLGGVGVAAIALIVFCCCNPFKRKKDGEKLLNGDAEQGQGQTSEGVPHSQTPQFGNINYTGEQSMQNIK